MVGSDKRQAVLAKLDGVHALEFRHLRDDAPLDAVRDAIADTIVAIQFCRRGSRRLSRYHPRLRSAIDLVMRSLDDNAGKPWRAPFSTFDARMRSLLKTYRLRVRYEHRFPMELTNTLVLTVAGILRAVVGSSRPLENLPAILNASRVLTETGTKWSRQVVNKRLARLRGPQMSDLAALVPLTKERRLHQFRKPFAMFELKNSHSFIVVLAPANPPASLVEPLTLPVSPSEADRILSHELIPVISPLFPKLDVPYMTCCNNPL